MLADKMVKLDYEVSISHETNRKVLKKRVEAVEGSRGIIPRNRTVSL
jgi:hypothetical protein